MECFAINFTEGNFINVFADSFESHYSVVCGCDIINFIRNGNSIVSVFRDQISKLQKFESSVSGCHYVDIDF